MIPVIGLLHMKGGTVWTAEPEQSVFEALKLLDEKNLGALPVVENGRLVGMFSERDYARKVALQGRNSHETKVGDIMTSKVYYVDPQMRLEGCMQMMTEKHIRHLPVVDEDKLVGIITIGDVIRVIFMEQERAIKDLENYVFTSMY
ncbi:MAG: CBS domain-containing protein [Bacteroidota bacterium]